MIYFGCYLLSVLTCQGALQVRGKRWQFRLLMALSVLFPVLLAGLRATSVGTDVSYYLVTDFRLAGLRPSFIRFLTSYASSREILYMLIVYAVKKAFDNINVVLFLFQLITIVGIHIGLYKHRNIVSMPLALAIFLLLFYSETLNLLRQWMGLGIIFAGLDHVENRRYWRFVPYVVVGAMFHITSLLALVIIPLHYILYHELHGQRQVVKLTFLLLTGVVCLSFDRLIQLVINLGFLSAKYMVYVDKSSVSGHNIDTVLTLAEIAILLVYNRRLTKTVRNFTFYKYNTYLYLIVLQLGRVMFYGNRFAATFRLINILTLAALPGITSDRRERQIIRYGLIALCSVYCWYMYIYAGVNGTYPYLFAP